MTKRAFAQILEKRPECTDEFENVRKLDNDLSTAIESVRKGRQGLLEARKKFTGKFRQVNRISKISEFSHQNVFWEFRYLQVPISCSNLIKV